MPRRYLGTAFVLAVLLLGLLAWAVWTMVQMWTSVEGGMGKHEWPRHILFMPRRIWADGVDVFQQS